MTQRTPGLSDLPKLTREIHGKTRGRHHSPTLFNVLESLGRILISDWGEIRADCGLSACKQAVSINLLIEE